MAVVGQGPATTGPAYELVVVGVGPHRVSIRASGALDTTAVEQLAGLLAAELEAGRLLIRVDLSLVSSLDGSCAAALEQAHDRCLDRQGMLLLESPGDDIRKAFASTGPGRELLVTRTAGPQYWAPDVAGLVELVRSERGARGGRQD